MKLSFQGDIKRRKQSLYASWASILVHAAPGGRGGLEVELD